MGIMEGKAGLVTAAGDGIGRASAQVLAAEGARVVVSEVNDEKGEETVRLISEAGGTASYVHADIGSEEDIDALVRETVNRY